MKKEKIFSNKITLKDWQKEATKVISNRNGFWTSDDIDNMLLRMNSQVSKVSEGVRDKNIKNISDSLVDIFISILDISEVIKINFEAAVRLKLIRERHINKL